MLTYNQIKRGKVIDIDGEPYKVLTSHVMKKNRNKPSNQTKLKSLVSGKNIEKTFHAADKVTEAELERRDIKYLYIKGREVMFCNADNPKNRFSMDFNDIKEYIKYLKQNDTISGLYYNENMVNILIPTKVSLIVKESAYTVKGNTSSSATKTIVMENGLEISAPLFIKEGEKILINTETGEYSERDNK